MSWDNEGVDGWIDGCMDRWMHGWMDDRARPGLHNEPLRAQYHLPDCR